MPPKIDLKGKRFGRLLVLEDTGRRSYHSIVWKCRCDCGKITDVQSYDLLHGRVVSCGCYAAENRLKNLAPRSALGQTGGTNLSKLKSSVPQKNNRSGYRGVSWTQFRSGNGKWIAVINFKRTRYYLGLYDTPEEAHNAYLTAKEKLHDNFIEWYKSTHQDPVEIDTGEVGNA